MRDSNVPRAPPRSRLQVRESCPPEPVKEKCNLFYRVPATRGEELIVAGDEALKLVEPIEDEVDSWAGLILSVGGTQNDETLTIGRDVPITRESIA